MSEICCLGLVGDSSHTSFVRGPIAEATSSKLVVFTRLQYHQSLVYSTNKLPDRICSNTNLTTTPDLGTTLDSNLSEPPYRSSPATISSPMETKLNIQQ